MRWNRGALAYTALLVMFLGYFCYCNALGKAIYNFGDGLNFNGPGYLDRTHGAYVRGFNHK